MVRIDRTTASQVNNSTVQYCALNPEAATPEKSIILKCIARQSLAFWHHDGDLSIIEESDRMP